MAVKAGRGRLRRSISLAKQRRGQKVSSIIQSDFLGNSVDKSMHCECTGQNGSWEISKKSCYHRIECSVANSLAAFMWRRPLNSAALVVPTHRGPVRVSDGTSTQVVAWTTNKWRAKIIQREIYNVRDPWYRGGRNEERKTIAIKNWTCNQLWVKYIRIDLFKLCRWQFSSDWTILFTFSCHLNPF